MLNCLITVKGNGSGGYGVPKYDRTGPLSEFLVDNQVFYNAVTNHLKTCNVCTITEVLQVYLARRVDPNMKFNGETSRGLCKRAITLQKLAHKKKEILPPGLVNEFLWRGGIQACLDYAGVLSIWERFMAARVEVESNKRRGRPGYIPNNLGEVDRYLLKLAEDGISGKITAQELDDLVSCAEVMYA